MCCFARSLLCVDVDLFNVRECLFVCLLVCLSGCDSIRDGHAMMRNSIQGGLYKLEFMVSSSSWSRGDYSLVSVKGVNDFQVSSARLPETPPEKLSCQRMIHMARVTSKTEPVFDSSHDTVEGYSTSSLLRLRAETPRSKMHEAFFRFLPAANITVGRHSSHPQ